MRSKCQRCGADGARAVIGDELLCDRCADQVIARSTGMPELPDPPPEETIAGPDGRIHRFRYKVWRAPTGIVAEADEADLEPRAGYHFEVMGRHDVDIPRLLAALRARVQQGLSRLYLKPADHRNGWIAEGDEIEGRLEWSARDRPYDVVVDGRKLSWEGFGRALEAFEGWRFALRIEDTDFLDMMPPERERERERLADVISWPGSTETPEKSAGAWPEEEASNMPEPTIAKPTIKQVLEEFLLEQQKRLAPRTYRNYEHVIELLSHCLNNYGYQHLDTADQKHFHDAYDAGDEDAFIHLFGPDKIPDALGEFLGYFMIRKVMAGEELLKAAGTVTKKLVKWIGERGLLDEDRVADSAERAGEASRDLPRAERLSRLLYEQAQKTALDVHTLRDDDYIEDYLMISRVEPKALWFEGRIGPVPVPKEAAQLAQEGWSVNIVLGRKGEAWHVLEVGNVYP